MTKEKSYKQLEADLSEIMLRVEESKYDDLDKLISDYKLGMELINQLEEKLNNAKNSIKKV